MSCRSFPCRWRRGGCAQKPWRCPPGAGLSPGAAHCQRRLTGSIRRGRLRQEFFMPVTALDDITVIECATFVTGPYATSLLAELGARVIKIESPPEGDPYRYFAADEFYSPNFAHLNRNKESLALDLRLWQKRPVRRQAGLRYAGAGDERSFERAHRSR